MNNTIWNHAVLEIIDALEHKMSVNKEFDWLYETLIKSIHSEMDAHLDYRNVSKVLKNIKIRNHIGISS